MKTRRIGAVVRSHLYTLAHSPLRIMELVYWPILEVVLWGFLSDYLQQRDAKLAGGVGILIGAVVLWDVCFRSQQELAMTQLFGMWDRSQVNLYASPLTIAEDVIAAMIISLGRTLIGSALLCVFARVGFGFDIFRTGAVLVPAALALLGMGWSMGLVIRATILRFGSNAEVLAWSLSALLQPVCAVYYPVSSLPGWLQPVSRSVPASHVFEAVRAYLTDRTVLTGQLVLALVLDVVFIALGGALIARSFHAVKVKGLLSRPGY